MMWNSNGMSGWGYALMTLSMVLFWGLLAVGLYLLVRYVARLDRPTNTMPTNTTPTQTAPTQARPTAEELLAERFARGDIDEPEYRTRLDVLRELPRPLANV